MLTTERHPGEGDAPGVLVATMDDGKANALSMEMMAAITAAIGEAESDDAIGAMVVELADERGRGEHGAAESTTGQLEQQSQAIRFDAHVELDPLT